MLKTKELKGMQTYFILHDWMTDKLELHGVSLLVYGLIYSFSITGKEVYDGSLEYLSHRLSVSKSSVCRVLDKLVNSRLIEKSDIYSPIGHKYCTYKAAKNPLQRKGVKLGKSMPGEKYVSIPTWMTPIRKYNPHALEVFAMIYSYTQSGISYTGNDVYIEKRFKISKRTLQRTIKFLTSNGFIIDTSENVSGRHTRSYKAVNLYRFHKIIERLKRQKNGMFKGDFNEGADISDPAQGSAEPADELTRLLGNIGITASSTPEEITSAIQSYLHSGVPANAAEPKPAYSDQYDTPGKRYDDAADYYDDPNIFSDEDVMSDIENVDSVLMAGYAEQCENAADCISNNISGADFIQPSETDSMPYTEDMYALHEDNNKYFDEELVHTYYDRCEHAADCITNNISETDFIQAPKPYNMILSIIVGTFSSNIHTLMRSYLRSHSTAAS